MVLPCLLWGALVEQCREVYSALVHTVPDLWMRRGFSLCYYKQHTPCNRHGQASTKEQLGTRVEEEEPGESGGGAAGVTLYYVCMGKGGEKPHKSRGAKTSVQAWRKLPATRKWFTGTWQLLEKATLILRAGRRPLDHRAQEGTFRPLLHVKEYTRRAKDQSGKTQAVTFLGMRYGGKEAAAAPSPLLLSSGASQHFRKSQRQSSSDHEEEEEHVHQPCTRSTRAFLTALCAVVLPPDPREHPTALPSPSTPLPEPCEPTLTFYVSMQRHHPGSLRAAEGRVVNVIGERRRDAGRGGSRGWHCVLGGVFFMAGSAVLKPNLKQKERNCVNGEAIGLKCGPSTRPYDGYLFQIFFKKELNLEICTLKYLTSIPPASIVLFNTH